MLLLIVATLFYIELGVPYTGQGNPENNKLIIGDKK